MGRWVYREGKKGPISSYLRSYFFACLIFNFIGLIACMSVKYYDKEITKAKWKGAFTGLAFSVTGFAWAIIATSAIKNGALVVITALILLVGILFGILYKYGGATEVEEASAPSTPTKSISSQEMTLWVEAYLRNIGMSQTAIKVAVSSGKLSKSFALIKRKPSISKEDFLIAMDMFEFL